PPDGGPGAELIHSLHRPAKPRLASATAHPVDPGRDPFALPLDVDLDPIDDLPEDRFPISVGRTLRVPQGRDVRGQPGDLLAFALGEATRLPAQDPLVLLDEVTLDPELLLPGRFQAPGDQPILRLHGVILTRRPFRFVGSTLQSLLPERPGRVALVMEVV